MTSINSKIYNCKTNTSASIFAGGAATATLGGVFATQAVLITGIACGAIAFVAFAFFLNAAVGEARMANYRISNAALKALMLKGTFSTQDEQRDYLSTHSTIEAHEQELEKLMKKEFKMLQNRINNTKVGDEPDQIEQCRSLRRSLLRFMNVVNDELYLNGQEHRYFGRYQIKKETSFELAYRRLENIMVAFEFSGPKPEDTSEESSHAPPESEIPLPSFKNSPREVALQYFGLSENATQAEINKTFRKMSLETHPDKFANLGKAIFAEKTEAFKLLQHHYEVLKSQ